ncbi:CLUMA_CG021393, isoform A [Clunio marinus]|uniref:CLUMA_CG021393, isoform A n=1 Tax=Clunio marinus TaxID=568069 RepID=A0A1J1J9C0_9DIPT|nr:CLUMA_CG021393, isoform A [Clunio marinus]
MTQRAGVANDETNELSESAIFNELIKRRNPSWAIGQAGHDEASMTTSPLKGNEAVYTFRCL